MKTRKQYAKVAHLVPGVVQMRAEGRTMDEIGRTSGLTRQRIQQIESRALAKLRHPARLRRFARWL
jgi:DNA-directed RNA polymerase sigma subunit (sigma70/sigma32)